MKATQPMKRRQFIRSTVGVVGAVGFVNEFGLATGNAAETPTRGPVDQAALQNLMEEMESKGRRMLSVPRKDGQFLNLLIKVARAKSVLEVGTSQGYSAIWISLGLEETGGKMTTIDIAPEKVTMAKANLARAGLSPRVIFLLGDAHQVVPTLEGPFDFVFLDADKEGQMDYFKKLYPKKLVPGGIIAVHNAIRMRESMKDYLDMMAKHPDFDSVVLSLTMEDGFSVSYRKRKAV
jgi:predicted O-methyltransferase YrrM